MELLSKLTVKQVAGTIKFKALVEFDNANPGGVMPVCMLYGQATGMKGGVSEYGEFVRFLGNFRGVNAETGEVFHSGSLILPRTAENLLVGVLNTGATNVTFAFKIGIRFEEEAATKYVYVIEPMTDSGESDPLRELEDKIKGALPALAAPAPAPAPVKKSKAKDVVEA